MYARMVGGRREGSCLDGLRCDVRPGLWRSVWCAGAPVPRMRPYTCSAQRRQLQSLPLFSGCTRQLRCSIGSLKPHNPPLPSALHHALPRRRCVPRAAFESSSPPCQTTGGASCSCGGGRAGGWELQCCCRYFWCCCHCCCGGCCRLLRWVGGHAGCSTWPAAQPELRPFSAPPTPIQPCTANTAMPPYPTPAASRSGCTSAPSLAEHVPALAFYRRRQGDPGESHLVLSFDDPVLNLRRPGVASLPQATYGALSVGLRCML